jgi:hypothetical protein
VSECVRVFVCVCERERAHVTHACRSNLGDVRRQRCLLYSSMVSQLVRFLLLYLFFSVQPLSAAADAMYMCVCGVVCVCVCVCMCVCVCVNPKS